MNAYTFVKEGRDWYIDLPAYIEQGRSKGDLQMVEGADEMLEMMAEGKRSVVLTIDHKPFSGADVLDLVEKCDPYVGGGFYRMNTYEGSQVMRKMWLCGVIEFVFGEIPSQIYVKRKDKNY